MGPFKQLAVWLRYIFAGKPRGDEPRPKPLSPAFFTKIVEAEKTPKNDDITDHEFHVVVHKGKMYWSLFRCPCGCDEVISLPLQAPHQPRWSVSANQDGEPTLYPSVWRNKGCLSHFWVEAGRVIWCFDSGIAPSEARPDLYRRPTGDGV